MNQDDLALCAEGSAKLGDRDAFALQQAQRTIERRGGKQPCQKRLIGDQDVAQRNRTHIIGRRSFWNRFGGKRDARGKLAAFYAREAGERMDEAARIVGIECDVAYALVESEASGDLVFVRADGIERKSRQLLIGGRRNRQDKVAEIEIVLEQDPIELRVEGERILQGAVGIGRRRRRRRLLVLIVGSFVVAEDFPGV